MNEKDFFDLTEGFRPEHIAEAAAWRYRPHKDETEQNEIAEIFSREMHKKHENAASEMPFKPVSAPAAKKKPVQNVKPQPRIAKGFAVGLTAVAAIICAAVGIVAYHAQKPENVVSDDMQTPAASITDAINEQTGTAPAGLAILTDDTVTSTEQSEQSAENAEEMRTAAQTAPEEFTGINYLGGQGHLRPIDKNTFEDDAYWYLFSTKSRIPKAAPAEDGIYHNELICQKAGCSHEYNGCPIAQYYGRLISDGEKIYYTGSHSIYTITDQSAGANGTMPEFFKLTNDSEGNAIYDLYQGCEMHFYHLTKLGDTGKWFVYVYFDYDSERVQYPVIFTPNTDQPFYDGTPMFLDVDQIGWEPMYDASTEMLWFGRWGDQTFVGFDINTGEKTEITVSEEYYVTSEFYAANGKLYGMANLTQSATSFNSQTDFISIDTATGELTVLEEATNFKNIFFIDGILYALRSRRVQADTIVRCDPDGSNEEVLYEHKGKITNINVLRDGFIYVSQDSGNYLMVDGAFLRVEQDML